MTEHELLALHAARRTEMVEQARRSRLARVAACCRPSALRQWVDARARRSHALPSCCPS